MIERFRIWLTGEKHSTYGLAVTRMLLGFIIASQLTINWFDRGYTWGSGAGWAVAVRDAKTWPGFLDVMFVRSGGVVFDLVYLATIIFALMMVAGFYTRTVTVLSLFLWMSLYVTNPFVGSGGDSVLRMVLLYMCFLDAGRHWSVDSILRRRRGILPARVPFWLSATLHNVSLMLIIQQIVMVYVASSFWKLESPAWMSGKAVYYPLQVAAYSPWRDQIHLLTSQGWIISAASYTAIIVQLFVPVLLMYRPTRFLALIALTGMHLSIGILMGILFFSLVMIAVDVLLISDKSWKRLESSLKRLGKKKKDYRVTEASISR